MLSFNKPALLPTTLPDLSLHSWKWHGQEPQAPEEKKSCNTISYLLVSLGIQSGSFQSTTHRHKCQRDTSQMPIKLGHSMAPTGLPLTSWRLSVTWLRLGTPTPPASCRVSFRHCGCRNTRHSIPSLCSTWGCLSSPVLLATSF